MAQLRARSVLWTALLVSLVVSSAVGHLCLILPHQRGDMDVSSGGSSTCFRHGSPCGGVPAQSPPAITVKGGQPIFIKWQQNYNHYSVGFPGYMDIAYGVSSGHRDEKDVAFTVLAEVPDLYEHDQAHQRNYTAVVTLPNEDCDHCIIRARYAAHKPGETTFYQCADIRVQKSSGSELLGTAGSLQILGRDRGLKHSPSLMETLSRSENVAKTKPETVLKEDGNLPLNKALELIKEHSTIPSSPSVRSKSSSEVKPRFLITAGDSPRFENGPSLVAMANNMESVGGMYYSIDIATGERHLLGFLGFRVDSPHDMVKAHRGGVGATSNASRDFVTDGVISFDPGRRVTVLPLNDYGNMDARANRVVEIDTMTGSPKSEYSVSPSSPNQTVPLPFSAVLVEIESSFVTFSIVPAKDQGKYDFVIGRLSAGGKWAELYKTDQSELLYINFQWAEYDISAKTLYVLLGNENDASNLSARLYKFFVPQSGSPVVPVSPTYSYVQLDVSKFTFSSFHLNPMATSELYAISPGRHGQSKYPGYSLVKVNVDSGAVTEVMQVAPPGIFAPYYGGTVYNGLNSMTNQLVHVLRVGDTHADVILTVDLIGQTCTYSQPTSVSHLYNLAWSWGSRS